MIADKFAERLTELRQQQGISARNMSLSLGQSENYINKIESKRSLPSLKVFFYICEYFGVTPKEFFDFDNENPKLMQELTDELRKLDYKETTHILEIVKDINKRRR